MSSRRLATVAGAALILAACSIGEPIPQATTYVVEPPPPAVRSPGARRPEALRMGSVRVVAAFSGNGLVYRMTDVKYVSDPYHAFIAEPGALLGNRIADWLDRAGPFVSVTQPGSARPAPYVLDVTVTELYGDFRPGQKPAAVLAAQFVLIDQTGVRPQVALERSIGRRVDIEQPAPDALVRGYGSALAEILTELSGALQTPASR
jgi:uncharacterized lipoprotein YmbA